MHKIRNKPNKKMQKKKPMITKKFLMNKSDFKTEIK